MYLGQDVSRLLQPLHFAQERCSVEHFSVIASRKSATEPIALAKCLEAFTQEEEFGEENKIYCVKCKSYQQVTKKLQIWQLPPILIFHLKRLQNINSETLIRYKELLLNGSMPRKQGTLRARNIGTIEEASELAKTLTEEVERQS